MTQRSILITGCSSGIGYDGAVTLKNRGWRVFATCRKQADCERLLAEGLESFVLDYDDSASIGAAVAEALSRTGGTLDAVFNNGAYALPALTEDVPRGALRAIFETNLFGPFELIRLLMPTFRAQGHGRIVNCSSVLGIGALRARGPYASTKFAMEALSDTLRLELYNTGIHISLIEPGPIPTEIRRNSQPHFERWIDWANASQRAFYEKSLIPRLYDESGTPDKFELPVEAVTKKLIYAVEARRPKPRYYVTTATWLVAIMKRVLPTRALDALLVRQ